MARHQTQAEKLADAYEDAEMFLGETITELEETMKSLRAAKSAVRIQRMNLVKRIKQAGVS